MMKGLYSQLLLAYAILLLLVLTGLGIVLGQFFPLFADDAENALKQKYLGFLILTLCIAFVISMLISTRMMRKYTNPIDVAAEAALRISTGEFKGKMPINEEWRNTELSQAINQIAEMMQEMSTMRTMEKERLKTLVESMGSALLMIGREGSVNLVNGVFTETFGFSSETIIKKSFNDIGMPEEIVQLIDDVFMTEQASDKQVRLGDGPVYSYVNVYGAPVIGGRGNWLGIIVVMHDISKLIRLEEVRKNFVANVSHELRTPITSIKGFTETLLDGALEEPEVARNFLEIIQKEGDRLQLLIDDLLELSGMEREGYSLELSSMNLIEVINDALRSVSGSLDQKKMKVQLDYPPVVVIDGDPGRLIQVMVNLLTNAIMYSKEETTITVSVVEMKDSVTIEVKDEGIGIAKEELSRLFERFYRVDRARSRDSGGTGLGLAIVKHLVEAHKGFVTVESTLGRGTTFGIHLPNQNRS